MAINKPIGYMICETASSEPKKPVILDKTSDRVVIEAILQDLNVKNRNGRYYPREQMLPQLTCPRTKELLEAGGMPGEAGHPMEKDLTRQQTIDPMRISHYITKLWNEGDDIKGIVRAARGPAGDMFNDTILDGIKVAFSLRALGTVVNTKNGAEVHNPKIITFDYVVYPSHMRAYQQSIITENASLNITPTPPQGIFAPFNTQQVTNFIRESSTNFKTIVESFELLYRSIELSPDKKSVKLVSENGDIVVCALEQHITNEIMSYCKNFRY